MKSEQKEIRTTGNPDIKSQQGRDMVEYLCEKGKEASGVVKISWKAAFMRTFLGDRA